MKQMLVKIKRDQDKGDDNFFFKTEEDKALFKATVPENQMKPLWQAWDYLLKNGWFHDEYYDDGEYKKIVGLGGRAFLVWKKPETDAEELELCLKAHDWYYEWSDAYNTYDKGEAERDRIKRLMKKVGAPKAVELYKKFAPVDMKWGLRLMGVVE